LNALGVTRLRPVRGGAEVAYRGAVERIRQPLPGTPVVMVANPKGGTGVTPATLMLSNAFGVHRGGGVVAWDNNECRGTLAARAAATTDTEPTVADVLANARALCSVNADAASLARFLCLQPTLDEVLASEQSGDRSGLIGRNECTAIMAVLRRHRSMVLIDTGDNDRAEPFQWSIENATQLVVPLVCRRDATYMVLRMLEIISARGRRDLVTGAVVALAENTATDPASRDAVLGALEHAGIARILPVPLDSALAGGERIVWTRLPVATTRAWTHVAASVADGLADSLSRTGAPLESAYLPETYSTPTQSCEVPQCGRCRAAGTPSDCRRAGIALPRNQWPYSERP
jgi:MinD-like ATPase involved in chromosome partitioning or flagellar assembly